jgi:hypothetical protein
MCVYVLVAILSGFSVHPYFCWTAPSYIEMLSNRKIPLILYIGTIAANFWFVIKISRLGWSNVEMPTNSSVFPMKISRRTHIQLEGTNSDDGYKHAF